MSGQAKFSCMCVHTCIIQAGRDHANRHLRACLRAPCSMVQGAEYSDPATNHGPNPSAGIPGRPEQPRRQAQEPPESPQRCHGIPRGSRRALVHDLAVHACIAIDAMVPASVVLPVPSTYRYLAFGSDTAVSIGYHYYIRYSIHATIIHVF